jgi:hypothetical protein
MLYPTELRALLIRASAGETIGYRIAPIGAMAWPAPPLKDMDTRVYAEIA